MLTPKLKLKPNMKIFHTTRHLFHAPKAELHRGEMVTPHESPHRMTLLMAGINRLDFGDFPIPKSFDISHMTAVHSPDYVDFLETAWERWNAAGYAGDVLPMSYPHKHRRAKPPIDIDGAAGYFSSSSDTVITKTSWEALIAAFDCSLSAAEASIETGSGFALVRPPGHHAGADYMSGYCLTNNAAISAQFLRNQGAKRVAVLDVDFHHGNGTQDIFYARDDVFFASIHGHPDHHFPYFWGHTDEIGMGAGEGFTANYPLHAGASYDVWSEALGAACKRIEAFGAEALVVSLGVDTYEHDPISSFKLTTPDYARYGARIAKLDLPTTFIMEGGYGVPEIGDNTANVLTGFLS